MSIKLPIERVLEIERARLGDESLVEKIHASVMRHLRGESLKTRLESDQTLKNLYQEAVAWSDGKVKSLPTLAKFLRGIGLAFSPDIRPPPWENVPAEAIVHVVVGVRHVKVEEMSQTMLQRAVGARDMEAVVKLTSFLQSDAIGPCRVQLHLVPAKEPHDTARNRLLMLRSGGNTAAVIVIGSPVVNPMADCIAEAILDAPGECAEAPATFRWAKGRRASTLSESKDYPAKQQGIGIRTARGLFFPRTSDDEVSRLVARGKQGPFPDCGILMVDCRRLPLLVLAAGHGGCGTAACVQVLAEQEQVAEIIEASRRAQPKAALGKNRLIAIVIAQRNSASVRPKARLTVDDLVLVKGSERIAWY
jgi:hypothetical protein